jgi:hypothetical protein
VRYELSESKARLEDITGGPVVSFSYPEGAFTAAACSALTETGYTLGRTTMAFRTPTSFEPARMPISIDFRRASRIALARHALRDTNVAGLADWLRLARLETDPVRLGKLLFDAALSKGGVFHVNARSWEIDGNHLWQGLDSLFGHVARRPGVHYATNSEALTLTKLALQRGRATAASAAL